MDTLARARLIEKCAATLRGNLPESYVLKKLRFRYTCPAREKGTYLPQWLWDSCFHAIAYRWFDPVMGWEELQSLLVHQLTEGPDAGMVPHMAHLAENDASAAQELFGERDHSTITQPPLIAVAARELYRQAPDRAALASMYPKILAFHDWFDRRRDDDDDGLVAIIHPWESGWDASQRWDDLMGLRARTLEDLRELERKRSTLVARCASHGYGAREIAQNPDGFYAEPVDFNAIRAADLAALAEIARELGARAEADGIESRAVAVRRAIREKMLSHKPDTQSGGGTILAHDLLGASERRSEVNHAGVFALLFGQCLTPDEADTLSARLFGPEGEFSTRYLVPSTARSDPLYNPNEYWRGNVWLSVNWLIWKGLRAYGRTREAHLIAAQSLALVEKSGFCEFFNPETGECGTKYGQECPKTQSWSTIVLDMLMGDTDE